MVESRLPPTAEELDELSEAFRRDPGRAFVGLGDALLALGRPRDAVEIGARGLQMDPGNLAGRLMVARAFAALHQWKEAQAELLKVVKTDRNHGSAFRLLGEVLMRRADYERALPVLQHAQNLSPADPSILSLLRRARAGQTLDPPPPIPSPQAPGAMSGGARSSRARQAMASPDSGAYSGPYSGLDSINEQPTRVAGEMDMHGSGSGSDWADDSASLGRVKLERVELRREGKRAPQEGQVRRSDARGADHAERRPVEHHLPPPTEDVFAPLAPDPVRDRMQGGGEQGGYAPGGYPPGGYGAGPTAAASMPTRAMPPAGMPPAGLPPAGMPPAGAPGGMHGGPPPSLSSTGYAPTQFPGAGPVPPAQFPPPGMPSQYPPGGPMGGPGVVRPRVVAGEKPRDAAQASLRQSAAVGEQYLNNLLVGGLLDIPRVRVPEMSFDLSPGRRWGRSTVRLFIYLFVILFMGIAGAGGWYWYAGKQRGEDVTRHIETALVQIDDGEYEGLARADQEARAAVERDRENTYSVALLAEVTALETFLYGEINPTEVQRAIELASQDIDQPTEKGYRELVLARAAHALSVLPTLEDAAEGRLTEVRRGLEKWLEGHADDLMARWLLGHALWAAGDRKGARAAFEQADKAGAGPAVASTSLGDILLDDGEFEKARAAYDRALARSPHHPWAFIGRSLTRSERSAEIQEAVADLNVGVAAKRGPRVEAWKQLATATVYLTQQDYEGFAKALDLAVNVPEPRFLVRVGLHRVQEGQLSDAARARKDIRWYADKPQPDPLVIALDAELRLASGLPREAFAAMEKEPGLRAARLRGRALFDMGKWEEAVTELDQALQLSPRDLALQVWTESARLVVASGDDRRKTEDLLDSLGRQSKSKGARVPQAVALVKTGRRAAAREKLELSLKDVSTEYPNPLAYRAHQVLGEIDVADGKLESAAVHVDKALELNAGYLPAHDLACRLLAETAPDKALPHCVEVIKAEVASVPAELAFVRAMTPAKSAEDTKAAADALRRAKQKGAGPEELQEYIPLVDTALFAELGVPEPSAKDKKRR
ncbi:MAG TPA: tetratricopeptide repeat protein [Kofleriaceae bacterium]|nr:tetratricopeptide repeat protein [Kofleriaceae bacterium]